MCPEADLPKAPVRLVECHVMRRVGQQAIVTVVNMQALCVCTSKPRICGTRQALALLVSRRRATKAARQGAGQETIARTAGQLQPHADMDVVGA
eukprot:COSAG01_NODE_261_length_20040_cov_33.761496_4_plen_94_part_00